MSAIDLFGDLPARRFIDGLTRAPVSSNMPTGAEVAASPFGLLAVVEIWGIH